MTADFEKRVRELIAEQLGVTLDQVVSESNLISDLGADSLDVVELIMALEDELGVEVPDEDAQKMTTVGAVLSYLQEKGLGGKRG